MSGYGIGTGYVFALLGILGTLIHRYRPVLLLVLLLHLLLYLVLRLDAATLIYPSSCRLHIRAQTQVLPFSGYNQVCL